MKTVLRFCALAASVWGAFLLLAWLATYKVELDKERYEQEIRSIRLEIGLTCEDMTIKRLAKTAHLAEPRLRLESVREAGRLWPSLNSLAALLDSATQRKIPEEVISTDTMASAYRRFEKITQQGLPLEILGEATLVKIKLGRLQEFFANHRRRPVAAKSSSVFPWFD